MDGSRFDLLARILSQGRSRREALLLLGGLAIGGLLPPDRFAVEAKRGKRRKPKTTLCHNGQTIRVGGRAKRAHLAHGDAPGPCRICIPQCRGKVCGSDGCGGECGVPCASGCCSAGACAAGTTEAACGRAGETCAVCTGGQPCHEGACVDTCGADVSAGPPAKAKFVVQDDQGLDAIEPVVAQNNDVTVRSFTAGTTDPVDVVAQKIDQTQPAIVVLRITDGANDVRTCGVKF